MKVCARCNEPRSPIYYRTRQNGYTESTCKLCQAEAQKKRRSGGPRRHSKALKTIQGPALAEAKPCNFCEYLYTCNALLTCGLWVLCERPDENDQRRIEALQFDYSFVLDRMKELTR